MIPRYSQSRVLHAVELGGKVVLLFGPRQVGKTTLMRWVREQMEGKGETLNGDYLDDRELLQPIRARLASLVQGLDYLFIDEAQLFPNIGSSLKAIHDHYPEVRVLATGSSALDLGRQTGEPLTGRHRQFMLYPFAYGELDPKPTRQQTILEHAMVFGTYPETWSQTHREDKISYLRLLASDYVLKDVFAQVEVNRTKLTNVLRLLALQVGSEVSMSEIGRQVEMDTKTVSRYLDLLEGAFVIVRLGGFSRNLRKEVAKSQKYYFWDLGIRNALVPAFQPLESRTDVGALWENLMVVERLKRNSYMRSQAQTYFWRTYDQQELDLIEEDQDELRGFEFKRGQSGGKIPRLWRETYPSSKNEIITPESAHPFLDLAGLVS